MDKINEASGEMDNVKAASVAKYIEPDGKLGSRAHSNNN